MKKITALGVSALLSLTLTGSGIVVKKGIEKLVDEKISQHEQNYKQRHKTISQKQLAEAFSSTYKIVNQPSYLTKNKEPLEGHSYSSGSGILLNGGYFLTAEHATKEEIKGSSHPFWSSAKYSHNNYFLTTVLTDLYLPDSAKKQGLEKIFSNEKLDYAILKLKDTADLFFYSPGLNLINKPQIGIESIVIGFPLSLGRNIRLGNVSQTESDHGKDFLTFQNSIMPADSGGPIFIVDDGDLKLTAITRAISPMRGFGKSRDMHPSNVGYGVKISSIIQDIEKQLKAGNLDKETAEELKNFLKLNKK